MFRFIFLCYIIVPQFEVCNGCNYFTFLCIGDRKAPQLYAFRLVGFNSKDLEDVLVKVHHNCDSSLLEICSQDEECVNEGTSCTIPSSKAVADLNIGKRMQGLARCLCDDDHELEYLGNYTFRIIEPSIMVNKYYDSIIYYKYQKTILI